MHNALHHTSTRRPAVVHFLALSNLQKIKHGSNCLRKADDIPLAAASYCITDFLATFLSNGKSSRCRAVHSVALRMPYRNDETARKDVFFFARRQPL